MILSIAVYGNIGAGAYAQEDAISSLLVTENQTVGIGPEAVRLVGNDLNSIPWNLEALRKVPAIHPSPEVSVEGLRSLYFDGLPFTGKPTRVFAFYGVPSHAAGSKVPGIVLVHGGGGTAYADWVKLWNDRGYAAIAFDHTGSIPVKNASGTGWQRHLESGPFMGAINQINQAPADQWMYHAVADTILATSLLASFPEVDADKIGITGISWGGVIASTVAGLDNRLKFAVPVYGCGFISHNFDDGSRFVGIKDPIEKVDRWRELWDPSHYLPNARLPMLWVNGTNDFAFTLRAVQLSYRAAQCPRIISTHPRMVHGQREGSSPAEIISFADSIVKGGVPLVKITAQGMNANEIWVEYQSGLPVVSATLNYTCDSGVWQNRRWESSPAKLDEARNRASAELPSGAKVWFLSLTDQRNLTVSSEHETNETGLIGGPASPSTKHL